MAVSCCNVFVKYKNAVAAVAANHHCLPPSITVVAPPAPAAVVHYLRSPRFAFAFTNPPRFYFYILIG